MEIRHLMCKDRGYVGLVLRILHPGTHKSGSGLLKIPKAESAGRIFCLLIMIGIFYWRLKSATCYSYRRYHLKRAVVIHRVLFTPATLPLCAEQGVVKQVLSLHTLAIEHLKHATDTGMLPLPHCLLHIPTDWLFEKCTRRCHAFILWDWHFFFILFSLIFFPFQNFRMLDFRH